MTFWTLSSKPYEPTAGGWSTGCALCGMSSRRGMPGLRKTSPQSQRCGRRFWSETRRCRRRAKMRPRCRWRRRNLRGSWLPPEPSSSKTAPPSRGRGPGRVRPRRRLRRPSCIGPAWLTGPPPLPRRRSSSNGNRTHANRWVLSFSRSEPPSLRLGSPSSVSVWRGKRRRADSSRNAPHSRGRRRPSRSGMKKSRGSTGS
jgi:hypothetical protein